MSKRKAPEPEVKEVYSKSSKKSKTTNMGTCVVAFSVLLFALNEWRRLAGWLLMPDLVVVVGVPFGRQSSTSRTPPNCHVIETPKGELVLPRTLNPSSLLALDYPHYPIYSIHTALPLPTPRHLLLERIHQYFCWWLPAVVEESEPVLEITYQRARSYIPSIGDLLHAGSLFCV